MSRSGSHSVFHFSAARFALASVLVVSITASLLTGCGTAAKTRADVARAPSIAVVDDSVARVVNSETHCVEKRVGPERVRSATAVSSVYRMVDAEQTTDCSSRRDTRQASQLIRNAIESGLNAQNRQVVDRSGVPTITYTFNLERVSVVSFNRELEDEGENNTCQSRCNSRTCNQYEYAASVTGVALVTGPNAPDGSEQQVAASAVMQLDPSSNAHIFCSEYQAENAHRSLWSSAAWSHAETEVLRELHEQVESAFRAHQEAIRFRFEKIGGNEANDRGIDFAKEEQWGPAAEAFEQAIASAVEPDDQISAQYNAGLAYMFSGDLDASLDLLLASAGAGQGGRTDELITEVQRQVRDAAILESLAD